MLTGVTRPFHAPHALFTPWRTAVHVVGAGQPSPSGVGSENAVRVRLVRLLSMGSVASSTSRRSSPSDVTEKSRPTSSDGELLEVPGRPSMWAERREQTFEVVELVEAEAGGDGETGPQRDHVGPRVGSARRVAAGRSCERRRRARRSPPPLVGAFECDLSEGDRDEFAVSADRSGGFVGPPFDRKGDASSQRAKRRHRGGCEFGDEQVTVVAIAGVGALVGDDDASFVVVEHVDHCGGHHDLAGTAGQRDGVRRGSCGRCGSDGPRRVAVHGAGEAAGSCERRRRRSGRRSECRSRQIPSRAGRSPARTTRSQSQPPGRGRGRRRRQRVPWARRRSRRARARW